MSTQFEFTVPPDGTIPIVLPEEYYGKTVKIDVTTVTHEVGVEKSGILSLLGILKGAPLGGTGDERYDAIMEKYKRARDID